MDDTLKKKLTQWHNQVEKLKEIELVHFQLEASEKPLFYKLYSQSDGRTVSEREAFAYQNEDWVAFQRGLSESRASVNAEKRRLELYIAAYQSEYLGLKHDHDYIKRGN